MRTLVASSLALAAIVLFACGNDYSSDDPNNGNDLDGGGSSSGSSGSNKDGGSSSGEGGVVEPGKPMTVTGTIVSYGVGLPNVPVVVAGKPAVNTSTLGTFTVTDVTAPYDVAFAVKTNDSQPRVTVYQGLTRPDPTLVALGTNGELRPNGTTVPTLTGKVSGANGPNWGRTPIVSFGGPNRGAGFASVDVATGNYTMSGTDVPTWYGATSITGSLHASLVLDNAAPVTAWYAKIDNVALTGGTAATDKNITLASVPVGQLEATITAPQKYNDPTKAVVNMGIRYTAGAGYFVKSSNTGQFPLTVKRPVPLVNGGSYQVSCGYAAGGDAEASFARATTAATESGKVMMALADPPAQMAPDAGATGVAHTASFTFAKFPNGIQRFALGGNNQPSVTIVTAATSITIPDLTPFAITIPSGVELAWRVAGFSPVASMDANELPVLMAATDGSLPNADQAQVAISPARKVTFAP